MRLVKLFILCLIVGLVMGFAASFVSERFFDFSPYFITIPAAFVPFFTGSITIRKEDD